MDCSYQPQPVPILSSIFLPTQVRTSQKIAWLQHKYTVDCDCTYYKEKKTEGSDSTLRITALCDTIRTIFIGGKDLCRTDASPVHSGCWLIVVLADHTLPTASTLLRTAAYLWNSLAPFSAKSLQRNESTFEFRQSGAPSHAVWYKHETSTQRPNTTAPTEERNCALSLWISCCSNLAWMSQSWSPVPIALILEGLHAWLVVQRSIQKSKGASPLLQPWLLWSLVIENVLTALYGNVSVNDPSWSCMSTETRLSWGKKDRQAIIKKECPH